MATVSTIAIVFIEKFLLLNETRLVALDLEEADEGEDERAELAMGVEIAVLAIELLL